MPFFDLVMNFEGRSMRYIQSHHEDVNVCFLESEKIRVQEKFYFPCATAMSSSSGEKYFCALCMMSAGVRF